MDSKDCNYRKEYLAELFPDLSQKDAAIAIGCEDKYTIDRFLSKLEYKESCIEFTGQKNRGYGYFYIHVMNGMRDVAVKAHRFSFALHHGFDALPKGKLQSKMDDQVLNHLCHNRSCVNPLHLEVITQRENVSLEKKKPR